MKNPVLLSAALFASARRTLLCLTGLALLIAAPKAEAVSIYAMRTSAANVVSNWAFLTPDPNPNQIYMVMPNGTPNGINAVNDNHPIGVWFSPAAHNWAIFNQDLAAMPLGTGFNVWSPAAASNVYTHRATAANIRDSYTYLDNVWLNGRPNALVWVTQNWNPGGVGGIYNVHHVGVWYDVRVSRWAVFNEDLTPMRPGAAFNIVAEGAAQYPHHFVLNSSLNSFHVQLGINSVWCNNYPQAQIFVTPVYNPGGSSIGVMNNHALIVRYDAATRTWSLANQDGALFAPGAAFNVWVVSH